MSCFCELIQVFQYLDHQSVNESNEALQTAKCRQLKLKPGKTNKQLNSTLLLVNKLKCVKRLTAAGLLSPEHAPMARFGPLDL